MRPVDLFDAYLKNELANEQRNAFEERLNNDLTFKTAFEQHKSLIDTLQSSEQNAQLKANLKAIHASEFGNDGKIILSPLRQNHCCSSMYSLGSYACFFLLD
jgi:hypothetical protein